MRYPGIVSLVIILFLTLAGCTGETLHHEIKSDILLKDRSRLLIATDYTMDSPEALDEVLAKQNQLRFALTLALRDHRAAEFEGRGKRNVFNVLTAISRQVLDHKVKKLQITSYHLQEH